MIYYYELFSVDNPRRSQKQQIIADTPGEAVNRLKQTFGGDLQVVYDENFVVEFESIKRSDNNATSQVHSHPVA